MKKRLSFLIAVLILCSASGARADKICLKVSLSKGKIKQSTQTVTGSCSRGFKAILDTSTLVGPPGPQGIPGSTGATGATGANGGFSATLPSGQLSTGVFGGFALTNAAGQYLGFSHTFPFSLATGLTAAHYLTTTDAATTDCPGTALAPDARAGHLCLYETSQSNRASPQIFNTATGNTSSLTWKSGFTVFATSAGSGAYISFYGTYAVRAP